MSLTDEDRRMAASETDDNPLITTSTEGAFPAVPGDGQVLNEEEATFQGVEIPVSEWAWTPAIPTNSDTYTPVPVSVDWGTTPSTPPDATEPKPSLWDTIRPLLRETVETLILTAIIFVLIRSVAQNFRIEGYSMEPNFHDGQYLIVNKISYHLHDLERGDVIVFQYPRAPKRDFIKRVIGLPGEKVEIRRGTVYVNDEQMKEPYDPNPGTYSWGPQTVPEGEYFVLGDNRNNSSDSHTWGMLPRGNVVGKAWGIYWPPSTWGLVQYLRPSLAAVQ